MEGLCYSGDKKVNNLRLAADTLIVFCVANAPFSFPSWTDTVVQVNAELWRIFTNLFAVVRMAFGCMFDVGSSMLVSFSPRLLFLFCVCFEFQYAAVSFCLWKLLEMVEDIFG